MRRLFFFLLLGLFWISFNPFNLYAQQPKQELNPLKPRVPPEYIEAAKKVKPPIPMNKANIDAGKALFTGKATCFVCHGPEGKGDGPLSLTDQVKVKPRNFTNPAFHKAKTCGEMFWVASNGTKGDFSVKGKPSHPQGSGMLPYLIGTKNLLGLAPTPTVTGQELWQIVLFERSLGGGTC